MSALRVLLLAWVALVLLSSAMMVAAASWAVDKMNACDVAHRVLPGG